MTKRRTHPNQEPETPNGQRAPRRKERPADLATPSHRPETQEMPPRELDEPKTGEERGTSDAQDALMESYNG